MVQDFSHQPYVSFREGIYYLNFGFLLGWDLAPWQGANLLLVSGRGLVNFLELILHPRYLTRISLNPDNRALTLNVIALTLATMCLRVWQIACEKWWLEDEFPFGLNFRSVIHGCPSVKFFDSPKDTLANVGRILRSARAVRIIRLLLSWS